MFALTLNGRDCVGGSPRGTGSIDYSMELKIDGRGGLVLDDALDLESVRALGFAQHPEGLDHPIVSVLVPRREAPSLPVSYGRVAAGTAWPLVINQALDGGVAAAAAAAEDADDADEFDGFDESDEFDDVGAAPQQQRLITPDDDIPEVFLRFYEYFKLLYRFAVLARQGASSNLPLGNRGDDLRDEVVEAGVVAGTLAGLAEEEATQKAIDDMDNAVEVTRLSANTEAALEAAGARARIKALRSAEAQARAARELEMGEGPEEEEEEEEEVVVEDEEEERDDDEEEEEEREEAEREDEEEEREE